MVAKGRILGVIDNLLYEVGPVIADVNEVQHIEYTATAGDFYLTYERDEFLPTALESAIRTREYLRTLGL